MARWAIRPVGPAWAAVLWLLAPGSPLASQPPLTEEAAARGLDFVHFNGMTGALYFSEMVGAGGALFDADGDGDLDLYLVQGSLLGAEDTLEDAVFPPRGPLGDRLYRNDLRVASDGSTEAAFVDVTASSGIAAHGYGMGVAAGDVDDDGFVDLYVTNFGSSELWRNLGDGRFENATVPSGTDHSGWDVAAALLDYDRDGQLDLYVGSYVDYRLATHKTCVSSTGTMDYCGPLAYPPTGDTLFRNLGDGVFEDVTAAAGMDRPGSGLGAVTGDFDGDGWVDLYVANDQMENFLWINGRDGTFRDEAILGGAAVNADGQPEASMGVVAGDLDGDGAEDLFMTHLGRETNTLYLNDGRGFFTDATRMSGLDLPSWSHTGFGVALFDLENDGLADLYVANGAVRRIEEQVRRGDLHPLHEPNQLFRNLGGGRFEEITDRLDPEEAGRSEVSRAVIVGDLELDGDADLVVTQNAGPVRLLVNRVGSEGSWVAFRGLSGESASGRPALGARVEVSGTSSRGVQRVRTDGSYLASGDPVALLGLGAEEGPVAIEVTWPGGGATRFEGLPPAHRITGRERRR